jgi:hypothetical protein
MNKIKLLIAPFAAILMLAGIANAIPQPFVGTVTTDDANDDLTLLTIPSVEKVNGKSAEETAANLHIVGNDPNCVLVMLAKWEGSWKEVASGFNTNWLTGVGLTSPEEFSWSLVGFELFGVIAKNGQAMDVYSVNAGKRTAGSAKIYGPDDKNFSHISFFGKRGTTVPDSGATLALLGLGLGLLGFLKRRK